MRAASLVRAGLLHYWRTNLGLIAGTVVASATLVGALVVGDSVRHSLARRALERLGQVDVLLDGGDRFFGTALAERADDAAPRGAPVVRVAAVVSTPRGDRRVHDVRVLGIDERFGALGPGGAGSTLPPPAPGEAWLGEALARRLELDEGAELVVRVERPSALPRDMALTPADTALALRVRVAGVLDASDFGGFDPSPSAATPRNLFVHLGWLQEELELGDRANLLLATGDPEGWTRHLARSWTLADAALHVEPVSDDVRELRTTRVFFDRPVVEALDAAPLALTGVFTYFVNGLEHGERSTPYSMVTGLGELGAAPADEAAPWRGLVPGTDEGLVLNRWAADDLGAGPGDDVTLRYWLVDASRRLVEAERAFRVARVVPLAGAAADPTLMPGFPGLADAESCREWEPGTPVDLERIRDEDEAYWDEHRGTPKAFVTLDAAEAMWSNRYGALTAVRFPASLEAAVRDALEEGVDPAALGLHFRNVRAEAGAASESPTDFGGLFVGLSFFLIVAAVVLAAQLFLLGVQQRSSEVGLLRAVGLPPASVGRLLLAEAVVLAGLGASVGALVGLGYTRLILVALEGVWSDAVSDTVLAFEARPASVAGGAASALVVVALTVWLAMRRRLSGATRELLTARAGDERLTEGSASGARRPGRQLAAVVVLLLVAVALVATADPTSGPSAAGAFFGAGALVLAAGLWSVRLALRGARAREERPVRSVRELGLSGTVRRPSRSLTTVCTMAIGTFLVLAIGSQRQGPTAVDAPRDSGTGGFAFYGRTSLPVVRDPSTPRGRELFGLEPEELEGVSFVPLRVRAGDDASCLNLSRAPRPTLVGVAPEELGARGAFRFASTMRETDEPWSLLDAELEEGVVPGVVDATSLAWQLHMAVGDTLGYTDERGRSFRVRIVGAIADSILQGDVLVSEARFRERFPHEAGFRAFLVDAPPERADEVSARLTRAMEDVGLALEPTHARLDAFHAVQNGYLAIFQVLGALGLLLGSIGLGTALLRNTYERRAELAVAGALGFTRGDLGRMIRTEYGALLVGGLLLGALAAAVAIVPAVRGPASDLSVARVALLFALVAVNGVVWVGVASWVAVARVPTARVVEE